MVTIKEAVLAKEKIRNDLETTIFYMDMRTFGKTFQRYRQQAETLHGVRFERGRLHSIMQDADSGDMIIRCVDISGKSSEATFDMVVLSVGQRPAKGTSELAEMLGLELNPWGFGNTTPFSLTQTSRSGILMGGSFAGLKDISDSVTQASAAALNASRVIHAGGGSLVLETPPEASNTDVMREIPRILAVICTCGGKLSGFDDPTEIARQLKTNPLVKQVEFLEQTCTVAGWEQLVELVQTNKPNRLLIGACLPYVYQRKLKELSRRVGIDPALMEVIDVNAEWGMGPATSPSTVSSGLNGSGDLNEELKAKQLLLRNVLSALETGVAKLKWVEPEPAPSIAINQKALVIGGGIAGMTAALAIADHGFEVDLVEKAEQLGGNLNWLQRTLEGHSIPKLMEDTCLLVERHPRIDVHVQSQVTSSIGQVGNFLTTLEGPQHSAQTLAHGVTILATGGTEAVTSSYGYGTHPSIITQKELEQKLVDEKIDPAALASVVMIQCVDSREEPRNYCSRVCCANSLKHALDFKEKNPELAIYILYRDMMAYGFTEAYYTRARKAGVNFIQYTVDEKPQVRIDPDSVSVTVLEPIIGQQVQIKADLVVLATGVAPMLPQDLAQSLGATIDRDGFFQEAESKWRPVDSLKEGIFACGLAHSPRNIAESITTAEAAAQRALRILSRERLPAGKVVAKVRHSLCSLCERCIKACPYEARSIDYEHEKVLVNPVMCQGCGSCSAVCPNSASIMDGFQEQQMFEMIDAAIG
jgi:heterodisulfide reductase subunit A